MSAFAQFVLVCDAKHHFLVEIHSTHDAFIQAIRTMRGTIEKDDSETRAVCLRYVAEGRGPSGRLRRTGELGTLFFVKDDMGIGAVVHELTHAAVYWAKRKKLDPLKFTTRYAHCPEEKFAYQLQSLVEQFYQKAPAALAQAA